MDTIIELIEKRVKFTRDAMSKAQKAQLRAEGALLILDNLRTALEAEQTEEVIPEYTDEGFPEDRDFGGES